MIIIKDIIRQIEILILVVMVELVDLVVEQLVIMKVVVEEDIGVVLHGKRTNIVLPIIMEHSHMLIQQEQL